jgi:hypothetical protein
MAFWLADYQRMLDALRTAGRQPQAVVDFLRMPSPSAVILRHDVDRWPAKALQMAELETNVGVRATYYFRCGASGRFSRKTCRCIAKLGHEVGYHYEDLSRCRGDRAAARTSFGHNLSALRAIVPCVTVSMHGSPLSAHNNGSLLDSADLAKWQLLGDASMSIQVHQPLYFTDAGGAWNDSRVNFRDVVGRMSAGIDPLNPAKLTTFLRRQLEHPAYFNVHPERWAASGVQYLVSYLADTGARVVKALVHAAGT